MNLYYYGLSTSNSPELTARAYFSYRNPPTTSGMAYSGLEPTFLGCDWEKKDQSIHASTKCTIEVVSTSKNLNFLTEKLGVEWHTA